MVNRIKKNYLSDYQYFDNSYPKEKIKGRNQGWRNYTNKIQHKIKRKLFIFKHFHFTKSINIHRKKIPGIFQNIFTSKKERKGIEKVLNEISCRTMQSSTDVKPLNHNQCDLICDWSSPSGNIYQFNISTLWLWGWYGISQSVSQMRFQTKKNHNKSDNGRTSSAKSQEEIIIMCSKAS